MHYLKMFDENGVATPNIESLSKDGLIFSNAFSNAPVCSVARSTIISGCYGPGLGSNFHRRIEKVNLPSDIEMFPTYFKKAGYYTANNSKEDYNIVKPENVWDESSKKATWRNRAINQPFFYVFNSEISHEGNVHFSRTDFETKKSITSLDSFTVQPTLPNTPLFIYTNAIYRDKIVQMDKEIGKVISQLKEDGLYDNTFVFYYGDNGGVLPGSKGYLTETGVHIPMVVHVPKNYRHLVNGMSGKINGFVSFADLAPTALNLAGIEIPKGLDGKPFLGKNLTQKELNKRNETFSYSDRMDEKFDMVRALRKGKYKYVRNYQPFNFDGLMNNYRYQQLAYQELAKLYKEGKLNEVQSRFFETKKCELLFDIEKDPYEINNLAEDPKYNSTVLQLRSKLSFYLSEMPDLSFFPEHFLIKNAFDDPKKFGQEHKQEILNYIKIADLSLSSFNDVKPQIEIALNSKDPWERYWGLIVCSSFGKESVGFEEKIREMAQGDSISINKVRAYEFIGLVMKENTLPKIASVLYKSNEVAEALLILNTMTLLTDIKDGFKSEYNFELLSNEVKKNGDVKNRINYLTKK
jgi:arylsulfatase A-like enzyme